MMSIAKLHRRRALTGLREISYPAHARIGGDIRDHRRVVTLISCLLALSEGHFGRFSWPRGRVCAKFRIQHMHGLGAIYAIIGGLSPLSRAFWPFQRAILAAFHGPEVGSARNFVSSTCTDWGRYTRSSAGCHPYLVPFGPFRGPFWPLFMAQRSGLREISYPAHARIGGDIRDHRRVVTLISCLLALSEGHFGRFSWPRGRVCEKFRIQHMHGLGAIYAIIGGLSPLSRAFWPFQRAILAAFHGPEVGSA